MEFGYNIEQTNDITEVALSGNLIDKNQANQLMDEIEEQIVNGKKKFVINLSDFHYMNSNGLNVLIHILTKARKNGGEAVICSMPEKIKQLLVITKLISVFNIAETKEQAMGQLA